MKSPGQQPSWHEESPENFPPEYIYGYTRLVSTKTGHLVPEISIEVERRAANTSTNVVWKLKLLKRFFEISECKITDELLTLDNMSLNALLHLLAGVIIIGNKSPYDYQYSYRKLIKYGIIELARMIREKGLLWPLTAEGRKFDEKIDEFLSIIETKTGIKPTDLFIPHNIPAYFRGSKSPAAKNNGATRSLEEVLEEIALVVSGESSINIAKLVNRTAKEIDTFVYGTSPHRDMLSQELITKIRKLRGLE